MWPWVPAHAAQPCWPLVLALAAANCAPLSFSQPQPRFDHTIRLVAEGDSSFLRVTLVATGIRDHRGLVATVAPWGEWNRVGRHYLRTVTVNGVPTVTDSLGLGIPLSTLSDGTIRLSYHIAVLPEASALAAIFPLLPHGSARHVVAFLANTVATIRRYGAVIAGSHTVTLASSVGLGVYSGWRGYGTGDQTSPLTDPSPAANGLFVIGAPGPPLEVQWASGRAEVLHVGIGSNHGRQVGEVVAAVAPALERAIGIPAPSPLRVVTQGSLQPGVSRGTATTHGILLSLLPTSELPDAARQLVAHELTHTWIGESRFRDESLTWLTEGFTEYLAMWAGAAAGIATPVTFAQRIVEHSTTVSSVARATHPTFAQEGVNWRAGHDAETIAYSGGA